MAFCIHGSEGRSWPHSLWCMLKAWRLIKTQLPAKSQHRRWERLETCHIGSGMQQAPGAANQEKSRICCRQQSCGPGARLPPRIPYARHGGARLGVCQAGFHSCFGGIFASFLAMPQFFCPALWYQILEVFNLFFYLIEAHAWDLSQVLQETLDLWTPLT